MTLLAIAALAFCAHANDDEYAARHLRNQTRSISWINSLPKHGDAKTWPGIYADRKAGTVTVLAESTGLGRNVTIEFPLVCMVSNHDYESMALMLGKPTDLAHALEWLGMPRGTPSAKRRARFWPKGERAFVTVARFPDGAESPLPAQSISEMLGDGETHGPAFETGFVYTGSIWKDDGTCEADGDSPGSVITTYNEPASLFDVPMIADKGAVYGRYTGTFIPPQKGGLMVFTFKPEKRADGLRRVLDVAITAAPANDEAAKAADLRFTDSAADGSGWESKAAQELPALFERLMKSVQDKRDVFTRWTFDDRMTVAAAAQLATAIGAVEGVAGIRVDEPPDGQLYYRAFLPDPEWIPRGERLVQPFELHLERNGDGTWKRTFISIDEDWSVPNRLTPVLTVNHHPVTENWKTEIPAILKEKDPGNRKGALFVFVPETARLADFMPYVRVTKPHLFETHVFTQAKPE